jgi:hypothetical protein
MAADYNLHGVLKVMQASTTWIDTLEGGGVDRTLCHFTLLVLFSEHINCAKHNVILSFAN